MPHDPSDDFQAEAGHQSLVGRCVATLDAASWEQSDVEELLRAKLQEFADEIDAVKALRNTF